jgi:CheY-like chemotaxis protein
MDDHSLKILVVDNNPGDLYIIEEGLNECGYPCEAIFAVSHQEALDRLSRESFHLTLSYFGTNRIEGQAFLREAKALAPRMPIVIMSGNQDPDSSYDAGANAYVKKVSNLNEFFGKLKGIVEFWCAVAELPKASSFQARTPAAKSSSDGLVQSQASAG